MRIVARAEWRARKPTSTPAKVPLSARTATCIHHDGPTPVIVRTFEQACQRMRDDQNYHMDRNGWADIGYNFLVISAAGTDVDGLIFEGRGRDVIGAHCKGWNTPWIGIQVAIGGGQTPSPKALVLTRWLHDSIEAAKGRPLAKKVHSDGFNTACPDPKLRAWVRAGMPTTATIEETDMPLTPAEMNAVADLTVRKLLGTTLGRSDVTVAQSLQRAAVASAAIDTTALAKAIVATLPVNSSNITAEALAKAVNDDAAKRLGA